MTTDSKHGNKMHLIIGGDSTLGGALADDWRQRQMRFHASTRRHKSISPVRPYIDLQHGIWPDYLGDYRCAVFCAGIANLLVCEHNRSVAQWVNVTQTVNLASALIQAGCFVVFLSTNQVFDGRKPYREINEPVCPVTAYGEQKAEAEQQLLALHKTAVLRLTKVVHADMPLLQQWRQDILAGKRIYPFADMTFAPVWLSQVVQRVTALMHAKPPVPGIFHLSGQDQSYYDFAVHLCRDWVTSPQQIEPASYQQNAELAKLAIPAFTSLKM